MIIFLIILTILMDGCFDNISEKDSFDDKKNVEKFEIINYYHKVYESKYIVEGSSPSLIQNSNGQYLMAYTSLNGISIIQSENLITWTDPIIITTEYFSIHRLIQKFDDGYLILFHSGIFHKDDTHQWNSVWIMNSNDGISWSNPIFITDIESDTTIDIIKTNNEDYIIITESSIFKSENGISWEKMKNDGVFGYFTTIKTIDNQYVIFNGGGTKHQLMKSNDAINWETEISNFPIYIPEAIQMSNGTYVIIDVYHGEVTRSPTPLPPTAIAGYSNNGVDWCTPRRILNITTESHPSPKVFSLIEATPDNFILAYQNNGIYIVIFSFEQLF